MHLFTERTHLTRTFASRSRVHGPLANQTIGPKVDSSRGVRGPVQCSSPAPQLLIELPPTVPHNPALLPGVCEAAAWRTQPQIDI